MPSITRGAPHVAPSLPGARPAGARHAGQISRDPVRVLTILSDPGEQHQHAAKTCRTP